MFSIKKHITSWFFLARSLQAFFCSFMGRRCLNMIYHHADLWQWITSTCNLLGFLDGSDVSQTPTTTTTLSAWRGGWGGVKKTFWWCNKETNPGVALLAANNESESQSCGKKTLGVIFCSTAVSTTAEMKKMRMWMLSMQLQTAMIRGLSLGDLFMLTNQRFYFKMLCSLGSTVLSEIHYCLPI